MNIILRQGTSVAGDTKYSNMQDLINELIDVKMEDGEVVEIIKEGKKIFSICPEFQRELSTFRESFFTRELDSRAKHELRENTCYNNLLII